MRFILLPAVLLLALPGAAPADLLLTEVFYDHSGGDDGYEWVEIYNASLDSVDLTGYLLANGGTDFTYSVVTLAGVVGPCELFVVGGPFADTENGNPVYDQEVNFDPDFQNSGATADAVGLFLPGADLTTDCPVDAVVYGGSDTNGLSDVACGTTLNVGDAPSTNSVARIDEAGTWEIRTSPDPNHIDFEAAACVVISIDADDWGRVKAHYR